jgi:hypothetical protein
MKSGQQTHERAGNLSVWPKTGRALRENLTIKTNPWFGDWILEAGNGARARDKNLEQESWEPEEKTKSRTRSTEVKLETRSTESSEGKVNKNENQGDSFHRNNKILPTCRVEEGKANQAAGKHVGWEILEPNIELQTDSMTTPKENFTRKSNPEQRWASR